MDEQPVAEATMGLRRRKGKLGPKLYDSFMNFRGPEVKATLAFEVCHSLKEMGCRTLVQDMELESGDSIPLVMQHAIYSSRVHISIFSPSYAESSCCLDELLLMLETKARFIPVFCDVKPFDLQFPEKGVYADALAKHEEKRRVSKEKLQQWRAALHLSSLIPGYEFSASNDNVKMLSTMIAQAVQQEAGKHQKDVQAESASTSMQVSKRFVDLASAFNWGALALVLGSYGLVLSNHLFWICWSILVIKAVMYNSVQPYWEWIEGLTGSSYESEGSTRPHTTGAIILKLGMSFVLITFLLCMQDIVQRQNIMLLIIATSVILFEGVVPFLRGIEGQKLKALIFLISSALNAMIGMTGAIVLGGDLGCLMCKEAFWGFTFIFLVDVLAEVFPRIVSGESFPSVMSKDFHKTHHVVLGLRMIVEGYLCWWMGKVIYQDSYFPSYLGIDDCNKLCRERSKHLLTTMVALGGLQAVATFIGYSLCCLLAHRHDPNLPLFFRPHPHIASPSEIPFPC